MIPFKRIVASCSNQSYSSSVLLYKKSLHRALGLSNPVYLSIQRDCFEGIGGDTYITNIHKPSNEVLVG